MIVQLPADSRDWLAARAAVTPHATALVSEGRSWSYRELDHRAGIMAGALASLVGPGERVAALMANSPAYVVLVHAAARRGAVLVPLNTRLAPAELAWQLAHVDAALLVFDDSTGDLAAALTAEAVAQVHVARVQEPAETVPEPFPEFNLARTQAIIFTSGTTGRPKGAVLSFANHFWSAVASAFRLGVEVEDRWLSCLPIYHVGGLAVLLRSCLYGTAVVLHQRFEAAQISQSLDRDDITLISLVPTMVYRLLVHRGGRAWPASLRHLLLGGAAATPDLVERCLALRIPLSTTYGLTEAASQVATMLPVDVLRKPGSVGKPLMFTQVQIVDEKGLALPPNETGEIVVSGPIVMAGYYANPEATAATLREGRLFTGDIGYLDDDGDLWLLQRRSDLIVSGGENVYPAEVEAVLKSHPGIADACVVGIPDAEWGQRVAALVVPRADAEVTTEQLLTFCREQLAGYKQPRVMQFAVTLPETGSGKIHRPAVLEQLVQTSSDNG